MPRLQCVCRKVTPHGYTALRRPKHPRNDCRGWVLEHIVVATKMYGGPLPPGAVVHHINGDRLDNRPENLFICTRAEHNRIHALARRLGAQLEIWRDPVLLGWPFGLPTLPPPWRG